MRRCFAHVVVLRVRLDRGIDAVAQDLRADEDHEVVLSGLALRVLKSPPISGMRPRIGHALLALGRLVGDQAAEHDDAAILDEHVRVTVRLLVMRCRRSTRGAATLGALDARS